MHKSGESANQRELYNRIHEEYGRHYYDSSSIQYRERFIMDFLLSGRNLDGKKVADLACGEGFNSILVKKVFPKAEIVGFDIADSACEAYRQRTRGQACRVDLTQKIDTAEFGSFDVALVIGGLHHCVADLEQTFNNIYGLLKKDGYLLFCEPNSKFFLETVRKVWYRWDNYFDENTEHALSLSDLNCQFSDRFNQVKASYIGGPAYFLILNSLILRMPLGVKSWLTRGLFFIESLYNRLPFSSLFPAFLSVWKKV